MNVTVNGEVRDIADGSSVAELLEVLGLEPKTMVVQRGDDIIARDDFGSTLIDDGDVLELIHFVGGG
jgi:thiamine biosynthesis protein ThiS